MSTDQDVLLIQAAIEKHGDRLFEQHSNLQVVCGGPFKLRESNRCVEKSNTIILYCHVKGIIPCGEDAFPSSPAINDINIPVDVREGYFALAVGRQEWHEPLCMGISIGESRDHRAGTLGPFVNLGDEGFGFLTCAHVVGAEGTKVVQPSDGDNRVQQAHEDTICGTVVKRIFNTDIPNTRNGIANTVGVDTALVKLNTKRKPDPTIFPFIPVSELNDMGFTSETTFLYTDGRIVCTEELSIPCGKEVVKYGRTTGLRKGILVMDGAIVKIDNFELFYEKYQNHFIMKSQYLIDRSGSGQFAEPGDSGSGVFALGEENKLTLIGLVIGVVTARFDNRCDVTPIKDILRALEISIDAFKFPENMEVDF